MSRYYSLVHLVLASSSPRRAELLRAAGFDFDVLAVDVDERVRPGEPPRDYVRRLAMEKSAAALVRATLARASEVSVPDPSVLGHLFLGADTVVVVDGQILGKPRDDAEAAGMLGRLSGRRHEVMTGVSLRTGDVEAGAVEVTTVEFSALSVDDLAWYVASGEGRDKAGAYAIQGRAGRFITGILGSYSNVVGLPIAVLQRLLRTVPAGSAGSIASGTYSGYSAG